MLGDKSKRRKEKNLILRTRKRLNLVKADFLKEYREQGVESRRLKELKKELDKTKNIFKKLSRR